MIHLHVDVDNLWISEEEYALPPSPADYGRVFEQALPHLLEIFDRHGAKATFFVTGRDLESQAGRDFVVEAARRGHELANHTHTHPPDLHRLSARDKEFQIKRCDELLTATLNRAILGFRAPGYYLDRPMIETLIALGYRYDTSVLPSFVNQAMKVYISAKSGRWLDKAFGLKRYGFASRGVTRVASGARPGRFLYEIPIATLPWLRLPVHTTFVYLLGRRYFELARNPRHGVARPWVYLFHAIDGLDLRADHPVSAKALPLSWPFADRSALVDEAVRALAAQGVVTTGSALAEYDKVALPSSRLFPTPRARALPTTA